MSRSRRWWRDLADYRARALLPTVMGTIAALGAVYWAAVRTGPGQRADAHAFAFVAPLHDLLGGLAGLLRAAAPPALGAVAVVLAIIALRARRLRAVVASTVAVLGSAAATRVLRDYLLTRPDLGAHGYAQNTLPSGHVAVVTALVLAVFLLWPSSSRALARRAWWIGAAVVAAVGSASVITYAHRPSDVLAAMLVGLLVTAVACWVVRPPLSEIGPGRHDWSTSTQSD